MGRTERTKKKTENNKRLILPHTRLPSGFVLLVLASGPPPAVHLYKMFGAHPDGFAKSHPWRDVHALRRHEALLTIPYRTKKKC